jgi:hypothetical protein
MIFDLPVYGKYRNSALISAEKEPAIWNCKGGIVSCQWQFIETLI